MNCFTNKARKYGFDVDKALERMAGDEELYESCFYIVMEDECFELLGDELQKGDVDNAIKSAHTLKGIVSNTGITPLLSLILEILNQLRSGDEISSLIPKYNHLMKRRDNLYKEFKQLCDN